MIPDHKAQGLHQNSPACLRVSQRVGAAAWSGESGIRPSSIILLAEEAWASHAPPPAPTSTDNNIQ
jgi:hypothetical protein